MEICLGVLQPRVKFNQPPQSRALLRAREIRLKEIKMYDVLREIIFYSMFLWILMVVCYGFRDPRSYQMKTAIDQYFTSNQATTGQKASTFDFNQVNE